MEQRDFLKEQIEQLSRVLAKVFADFIGWKNQGSINLAIQNVQQALQDELDVNLSKLMDADDESFIEMLHEKYKLKDSALEPLGDLFLEIGKSKSLEKSQALPYLKKGLLILEHSQRTSSIYSMERQSEIREIKTLIEQLSSL